MIKYKIFTKDNYFFIIDVETSREYSSHKADVLISKRYKDFDFYTAHNIPDWNILEALKIGELIKENDSPYTESEFETFYQQFTGESSGGSGGGGGGGGATAAEIEAALTSTNIPTETLLGDIKTDIAASEVLLTGIKTGIEAVKTGEIVQAIPYSEHAADMAVAWGGFAGVNWAGGDFVTSVSSPNGQSINAISSSPLTTGESYVVNYSKAVLQPCALEFAASFKQTGVSFATVALFANNPVTGPDTVPSPINIISAYQSSAVDGASYNAVAGTVLHLVLESALPSVGSNQAVFVGDWVNITGFADSRINYSNACIAFISADRKTISVTFSNEAALPSLAIAAITPTLGTAKIQFYNNMSGARNGFGIRFTGASSTSAAIVSIFGGDDNQTSGTLRGDQRTTVANYAPNYVSGAAWGQYEVRASSRYRLETTPSAATLYDKPEQSASQWSLRDTPRTSVKPASGALLYPRFRLYKPVNMTRPIGKIVSISKAGTTTATINLHAAPAEALAVGNVVALYGVRDQTNFVNSTVTITAVLSPTQFQAVVGSAVTATSYGGSVSIVNGGAAQPGIIAQQVTSVVSRVAEGSNWLDVIGGATWSGLSLGDYVDLYGVRESTAGTDVGVDGAWEVAHLSTTTMVLKPVFDIAGNRISPALGTLASVNCGGTVLIRPTLRAHNLSVSSWTETQVQIDGQGTSDQRKALPIYGMGGSIGVTQGTAASVGTAGGGAWIVRGAAHRTTDIAWAALTAVGQTNSAVIDVMGNIGAHQFYTDIGALTGTAVRMFTRLQGSYDNTTFFNIFDTPIQTTIANKLAGISPILPVQVPYIRYVRDLRGTTPSVSNSVTRMTRPGAETKRQRRMNDRVVGLTTTTPSTELLWVEGCTKAQITCTPLTGATTAPTVKLQVCNGDPAIASQWYDVAGATLALSATLTTASAYFDIAMPVQFARLVPTVAGAGVVADTYELTVNAWEA